MTDHRTRTSFKLAGWLLIPLLCLAAVSGPGNYSTVINLFLRSTTEASARSAIGAASSGSGGALTNAVIYGSTSGNVTFGATGSFIGTGTANGLNVATPATELHVGSASTSSPRGIMSAQYTTDALGARIHLRKARGTEAAPTVVVTGDDLGRLQWSGYDGNSYEEMASIRAAATGTIADTRVPTQLIFSTATDAAPSVLTDRMTLGPDGYLGINATGAAALARLHVKTDNSSGTSYGKGIRIENVNTGGYADLTYLNDRGAVNGIFQTGVYGSLGTVPDYAFFINSITAGGIIFGTSGSEKMRILPTTGAVGIGTTAPGSFGLAINHATGQSLDLIYNDSDGSPLNHASFAVGATGNLTIAPSGGNLDLTGTLRGASDVRAGAAGFFYFNTRSVIASPSDGTIKLSNLAQTGFTLLQLGGTTSAFVAAKRVGTTLAIRLADDSADAPISASNGTFSGYIVGGIQSLSGAGAVNVTQAITEVTTTGVGDALTLADGVAGQEKTIIHGVDGGSAVLTPTTKTGWSTATFTSAGESLTLVFLATRGWCVKSSYLAVVAP